MKNKVCIFIVCFMSCWQQFIFAQEDNFVYKDMYYYCAELITNDDYYYWNIPGVSDERILSKLDFSNWNSFLDSYNKCTYYCDRSSHAAMKYMQVHIRDYEKSILLKKFNEIDSMQYCSRELIKKAKALVYKFVLRDSSILYMEIYHLKGRFWKYNRICLSSLNPPFSYYSKYKDKGMYFMLDLNYVKAIKLKGKKPYKKNKHPKRRNVGNVRVIL